MAIDIVKANTLSTLASSSVNGTYAPLNTTPFPYPVIFGYIINDSTMPITISYDGVTDHGYIMSKETRPYNVQMNAQPPSYKLAFARNTTIYVKGTAGTGTIALETYYNKS